MVEPLWNIPQLLRWWVTRAVLSCKYLVFFLKAAVNELETNKRPCHHGGSPSRRDHPVGDISNNIRRIFLYFKRGLTGTCGREALLFFYIYYKPVFLFPLLSFPLFIIFLSFRICFFLVRRARSGQSPCCSVEISSLYL